MRRGPSESPCLTQKKPPTRLYSRRRGDQWPLGDRRRGCDHCSFGMGRNMRSRSATRTQMSLLPRRDAGSSPAATRRRSVSTLTRYIRAARGADNHSGASGSQVAAFGRVVIEAPLDAGGCMLQRPGEERSFQRNGHFHEGLTRSRWQTQNLVRRASRPPTPDGAGWVARHRTSCGRSQLASAHLWAFVHTHKSLRLTATTSMPKR